VSPSVHCFAAAVATLIGEGPVKQRLAAAYSLHLADLTDANLPPGLRAEFGALQTAVTRVAPVGRETRVGASVQKMSAPEAAGHAATILKLYVELLSGRDRAEPLKVLAPPRKPPRYLTGAAPGAPDAVPRVRAAPAEAQAKTGA
jgi:hypothetical protein